MHMGGASRLGVLEEGAQVGQLQVDGLREGVEQAPHLPGGVFAAEGRRSRAKRGVFERGPGIAIGKRGTKEGGRERKLVPAPTFFPILMVTQDTTRMGRNVGAECQDDLKERARTREREGQRERERERGREEGSLQEN